MNDKIAILMSTYNGEKYLDEQIQSIINQSNKDWTLYIRDDGSSDGTIKIIEKYEHKYDNIVFFNKGSVTNVGVMNSFMSLLKATSADYYMFSDQDDVWLEDKISDSLQLLKKGGSGPICVFTDAEVVNSNLKPIRRLNGNNVWTDFDLLLFANSVTGCTMLFNDELKRIVQQSNFKKVYMHDWWIALIATKFGKLCYLNKATMLYRQHGNNVIGENKRNTIKQVIRRLTSLDGEKENVKHSIDLIHEFYKQYSFKLSEKERIYMAKYAALDDKSSFFYNAALVARFPPRRQSLKGKLFFSYLLITNPAFFRN